jgi:hypothetical protein
MSTEETERLFDRISGSTLAYARKHGPLSFGEVIRHIANTYGLSAYVAESAALRWLHVAQLEDEITLGPGLGVEISACPTPPQDVPISTEHPLWREFCAFDSQRHVGKPDLRDQGDREVFEAFVAGHQLAKTPIGVK